MTQNSAVWSEWDPEVSKAELYWDPRSENPAQNNKGSDFSQHFKL